MVRTWLRVVRGVLVCFSAVLFALLAGVQAQGTSVLYQVIDLGTLSGAPLAAPPASTIPSYT